MWQRQPIRHLFLRGSPRDLGAQGHFGGGHQMCHSDSKNWGHKGFEMCPLFSNICWSWRRQVSQDFSYSKWHLYHPFLLLIQNYIFNIDSQCFLHLIVNNLHTYFQLHISWRYKNPLSFRPSPNQTNALYNENDLLTLSGRVTKPTLNIKPPPVLLGKLSHGVNRMCRNRINRCTVTCPLRYQCTIVFYLFK